ncbi:baseplate J/gp47 family protein [Asaia astilbis]|uniref:baseplate J/gp47 family protein n=1 Tax=Asaia astilbis TaxID=610244 RepID=UPI0006878C95|nr:baseplate J/gp47 family protein [Asaia astilbis]
MSSFNGTTSVPAITFSATGISAPSEFDILDGVVSDVNAAMGGSANPALETPQGQLATSETAAIANCYDALLYVANSVDPAVASGRMQDAIGNIYFMERNPAIATTVVATVTGASEQDIPAGTVLATDGTYQYEVVSDATLPAVSGGLSTGPVTVQNTQAGAFPCAVGALSLYQYVAGVSTVTNLVDGIVGAAEEGRIAFEERRSNTVAGNSNSQAASVLGRVLQVQGVTDAYAYDNGTSSAVTYNGVSVPANSLYVSVAGGAAADIGLAIIQKKAPGCNTAGGSSVTVNDPASVYNGNGPSYTVQYDIAVAAPIYVSVSLKSGVDVPSTALDQIQQAIISQFASGGTSGARPTIASTIYASQFSCPVMALVLGFVLSRSISAHLHRHHPHS